MFLAFRYLFYCYIYTYIVYILPRLTYYVNKRGIGRIAPHPDGSRFTFTMIYNLYKLRVEFEWFYSLHGLSKQYNNSVRELCAQNAVIQFFFFQFTVMKKYNINIKNDFFFW